MPKTDYDELAESKAPTVAGAVPINSWGGEEKGWTVYLPGAEDKA